MPSQKPRRTSTVKQIAEELGVSMMTVSRALNGRGRISDETRDRVLAVAKRLKYRPNRLVHAIKHGRSRSIGVMVPIATSFSAAVVRGIHDALAEHHYLPILHFHGEGPQAQRDEAELEYLHRLLDHRVDGIIFWPSDESVPQMYLREVWDRGVPLVAVDRHLPHTNADFSGTDDEAGGGIAAEHLLSLGHRRLAHITGERWVSTYADRRKGFEAAVAGRSDATCEISECADCDCGDVARQLLAARERPTAIFLSSDRMAPHVYAVAESLGITIGKDLSVVGFADLAETAWLRPRLTTVRQNAYRIGHEAARLLFDRLEGRGAGAAPQSVRVLPELVVRASTATLA